jgi:hypothetical protein
MKDEKVKKDFLYYLAGFCLWSISVGPGIIGFGYPIVRDLIKEIFK